MWINKQKLVKKCFPVRRQVFGNSKTNHRTICRRQTKVYSFDFLELTVSKSCTVTVISVDVDSVYVCEAVSRFYIDWQGTQEEHCCTL